MSVCIHGSYRLSDFRINDNALAKTSYAISQVRWPDFSRNYELLIDKVESKSKECFAALEDYGSRTKESCPPRACPGGCRGSRGARHGRQRIGERRLRAVRPGESFPFILCLLIPTKRTMDSSSSALSTLSTYRYHLLLFAWASITGLAFFRVSRQPYNTRIKSEQYETIFKGTSLAAALVGMGLSGTLNKRRSDVKA